MPFAGEGGGGSFGGLAVLPKIRFSKHYSRPTVWFFFHQTFSTCRTCMFPVAVLKQFNNYILKFQIYFKQEDQVPEWSPCHFPTSKNRNYTEWRWTDLNTLNTYPRALYINPFRSTVSHIPDTRLSKIEKYRMISQCIWTLNFQNYPSDIE